MLSAFGVDRPQTDPGLSGPVSHPARLCLLRLLGSLVGRLAELALAAFSPLVPASSCSLAHSLAMLPPPTPIPPPLGESESFDLVAHAAPVSACIPPIGGAG